MVRRNHWGLSLIELMVVLAIVMIVALIAVPLTGGWVKNTHQSRAIDVLREGYAIARAAALQNAANVIGTGGAASLSVAGIQLTVTIPTAPNPTTVWTGTIDTDTTISLNRTDNRCGNVLSLTNQGLPTNANCLDYQITVSGLPNVIDTL